MKDTISRPPLTVPDKLTLRRVRPKTKGVGLSVRMGNQYPAPRLIGNKAEIADLGSCVTLLTDDQNEVYLFFSADKTKDGNKITTYASGNTHIMSNKMGWEIMERIQPAGVGKIARYELEELFDYDIQDGGKTIRGKAGRLVFKRVRL